MPRVMVHVVTWNSAPYLPGLFASLQEQDFTDFRMTVVDNASSDNTAEWIQQSGWNAHVLRNFRNLGFSRAHNQALAFALNAWEGMDLSQCYVLITNPDLEFGPGSLGQLVAYADAHPEVTFFAPKLLRAIHRGEGEDGRPVVERTTVLDAVGMGMRKTCQSYDRGAGEMDQGQYDQWSATFGCSGACVMIRASVIADLKEGDQLFDEQLFAYKEDVDLAWRARRLGYTAHVIPSIQVWHHRRAPSVNQGFLWLNALRARLRKPADVNRLSTRNQWWLLWKHLEWWNIAVYAFWLVPYEAGRSFIAILTPTGWKAIWETVQGLGEMGKKRRTLRKRAKITGSEMRKWYRA